ncbi:hypothetical protein CVT26_008128 [Gymnopilus dilepis]|uniref:Uncharacterized protein n=1 Tax=Gymnopilus dilepis TaxID=231916 RepID=A0A409YJV1_9AGAR|nr:hypothetical protein CVT26_008128 [Gymnopilus dilepis]
MAQRRVIEANDPEVEKLIDEACRRLHDMEKPAYRAVIRDILEETGKSIPYGTTRRRFLGQSKTYKQAHILQQLLTPAAERVLSQWIHFYSAIANPLSKGHQENCVASCVHACAARRCASSCVQPRVTLARHLRYFSVTL